MSWHLSVPDHHQELFWISWLHLCFRKISRCYWNFNDRWHFSNCSPTRDIRKLRGTIVNIILPPRVSFYRREIYFAAASFILLPRVLFYCREFYFSTASFILLPRVLLYRREIYFAAASFIFTTASFIFTTCSKIKLAAVKIKLAAAK